LYLAVQSKDIVVDFPQYIVDRLDQQVNWIGVTREAAIRCLLPRTSVVPPDR
jgi:hypothetical protein